MKPICFLLLIMPFVSIAQSVADFEEFNLLPDTFDNGLSGHGGFSSGNIFIPNNYNAEFDAWLGWSLSTRTDTMTPGFQNQYSCIAGHGAADSPTYAVAYAFDPVSIRLQKPGTLQGIHVCNNTYTYLSMRDGDAFSKRFGGVDGQDPDFFQMIFRKYIDGQLQEDSIVFYLADYRFADASQDFIIKDWTFVDLSSLGEMDSLQISLRSSDVGIFGMNTPAYICVDQIISQEVITSGLIPGPLPFSIFPNPVSDHLFFDFTDGSKYDLSISGLDGKPVYSERFFTGDRLDVGAFNSGIYFMEIRNAENRYRASFIKL